MFEQTSVSRVICQLHYTVIKNDGPGTYNSNILGYAKISNIFWGMIEIPGILGG